MSYFDFLQSSEEPRFPEFIGNASPDEIYVQEAPTYIQHGMPVRYYGVPDVTGLLTYKPSEEDSSSGHSSDRKKDEISRRAKIRFIIITILIVTVVFAVVAAIVVAVLPRDKGIKIFLVIY